MDAVFRTRFKAGHLHLGTRDNAVLLCKSARLPPGHDPLVDINLVAQKYKGKIRVAVANAGLVKKLASPLGQVFKGQVIGDIVA